jgi:hypothetical protein
MSSVRTEDWRSVFLDVDCIAVSHRHRSGCVCARPGPEGPSLVRRVCRDVVLLFEICAAHQEMNTPSFNKRSAADAGFALCFYLGRHWSGAADSTR